MQLENNQNSNKKQIEEKIIEYISSQQEIIAAYIFGSFNQNRFNDNSDLDIACIFAEQLDKFERFNIRLTLMAELEKIIGRKVDLLDFENADLKMKHQILDGRLIYCSNQSRRVKLEKKAILNYIDMKRFFDIYDKNLGKGF